MRSCYSPFLLPPPHIRITQPRGCHITGAKASSKGMLPVWMNPATVVTGLGIARRPPGPPTVAAGDESPMKGDVTDLLGVR